MHMRPANGFTVRCSNQSCNLSSIMSRRSQLPPRCPFQKKVISHSIQPSYPKHHRFPSQGSIIEDQPVWLENLLNDNESESKGTSHRRSASDSLIDSFSRSDSCDEEALLCGKETCLELESDSKYGPNSPRQRGKVSFSENAIVSALSEYVFQNPLQYLDGSLCVPKNNQLEVQGDSHGSVGDLNDETRAAKRHPGQRSRVRKLQYIAELERTVNSLQAFKSELSERVASQLQERVALSLENSELKKQVTRMQQEKLIMESQYKALKKETERLRNVLTNGMDSKVRSYHRSGLPAEEARSEAMWQMLDMAKLNLNR